MSFFRLELAALTLLATTLAPAQTAQMPRDYRGVQIPSWHLRHAHPQCTLHCQGRHHLPRDPPRRLHQHPNHHQPRRPQLLRPHLQRAPPARARHLQGGTPAPLRSHLQPLQSPQHLLRPSYPPRPRRLSCRSSPASRQRSPQPNSPNNPYFKQEDIGTQPLGNLTLTGIRKTRIIPLLLLLPAKTSSSPTSTGIPPNSPST